MSVTAIPVWSENRKLVPAVFLTGALGSAAAVLELLGFTIPATQFIGIVASTVEIAIAIIIEVRGRYVDRPLREGAVGWWIRGGARASRAQSRLSITDCCGPHSSASLHRCLVLYVGALITRYAWIAAGRASSRDPQALFQIQRKDQNTKGLGGKA